MPGVTQEQIAAARRMSAIEFLQKYRPNSLVKSSAHGEYQLAEHDSFKINDESAMSRPRMNRWSESARRSGCRP